MTEQTPTGWRDAEEARERAREIVSRAYSTMPETAPLRRCPNCGVESATLGARCPDCDKRYDRHLPWLKDWMRWTLGIAAAAALITTVILVTPGIRESKQEKATRLAHEKAALVAAQVARLTREQRPVRGRFTGIAAVPIAGTDAQKLEPRRAMVVALEAAILADARARIARKQLDGPVRYVKCGPLIRGSGVISDELVLTRKLGRYDCTAVKTDVQRFGRVVALFGHPYVGTIDFRKRSYVFCKDNKAPGERGQALAKVTLAPECLGLDPDAARLGNGYVQPGD